MWNFDVWLAESISAAEPANGVAFLVRVTTVTMGDFSNDNNYVNRLVN